MENTIENFNSVFDTEEIFAKELKEFEIRENFKSLFNTKKRLSDELDGLNRKKKELLKNLKQILYNRDEKEKELKQINELIEKEKQMFPKEYIEYIKS